MNSIGERIAQLRKNSGFTQEILANTLGVSPRTVSKWETGTTMPDILLLPRGNLLRISRRYPVLWIHRGLRRYHRYPGSGKRRVNQ